MYRTTRRSKIWLVAAVLFLGLNLAGMVMAAMGGELLHTCAHAGLALLGAYLVGRLAATRIANY
jgi:hypothetical protein